MKTTRKTITAEEHQAIAPQIMDMQKGLDDLSYALFLSYPLDAPANRAVRKMRDACYELRQALQDECKKLDIGADLYLVKKEPVHA